MAALEVLELEDSRESQQDREPVACASNGADTLPTSVATLLTMIAVAVVAATFANLPLGFDGSYYVLKLLDESVPYVPHNRIGNILLQLPALAASRLGDQLTPAVMAFSFTYAVVPFLCLLACYLIVRHHNRSLLIWPAISIALVFVVLGPVMISENLIASELAWPLILGIITPPNRAKTVALIVTAAFMATLHPCSVVYFCLAAFLAWYQSGTATRSLPTATPSLPTATRSLSSILAIALVGIAVTRLACAFLFPAPYESDTLSSESWGNYGFRIIMSPLFYVEAYAIACGVLFLKGKNIACGSEFFSKKRTSSLRRFKAAVVVAFIGLTIGFLWSCEITMWDHCFFAGRFIVVPSVVLMICAVLDNSRRTAATADGAQAITRYRVLITNLAFVGILCQMLGQCTTWLDVKRRVEYALRKSDAAVIDIDAQNYPYGAPLAHWSTGSFSILLQGRTPAKVMLKADAVQAAREKGEYTINTIEPPLAQKWFRLPGPESIGRQSP